jgi:hypothetical protein
MGPARTVLPLLCHNLTPSMPAADKFTMSGAPDATDIERIRASLFGAAALETATPYGPLRTGHSDYSIADDIASIARIVEDGQRIRRTGFAAVPSGCRYIRD